MISLFAVSEALRRRKTFTLSDEPLFLAEKNGMLRYAFGKNKIIL
jgi:hypothetical protein